MSAHYSYWDHPQEFRRLCQMHELARLKPFQTSSVYTQLRKQHVLTNFREKITKRVSSSSLLDEHTNEFHDYFMPIAHCSLSEFALYDVMARVIPSHKKPTLNLG